MNILIETSVFGKSFSPTSKAIEDIAIQCNASGVFHYKSMAHTVVMFNASFNDKPMEDGLAFAELVAEINPRIRIIKQYMVIEDYARGYEITFHA